MNQFRDERIKYNSWKNSVIINDYNRMVSIITQPKDYNTFDLNDILEFYNLSLCFKNNVFEQFCPKDNLKKLKDKFWRMFNDVKKLFYAIREDDLLKKYEQIDFYYQGDFWALFSEVELYKRISPGTFKQLIHKKGVSLFDLFSNKDIVNAYGSIYRDFIFENKNCIDVVLASERIRKRQSETTDRVVYLPQEFSQEDLYSYIDEFIRTTQSSMVNLQIIWHADTLPVDLRAKAQKRYEIISNELRQETSLKWEILVSFSLDQEEEVIQEYDTGKIKLSYSLKHLSESLDYPNILQNFLHIFSFVDSWEARSEHVYKENEDSTLIKTLLMSDAPKYYPVSPFFQIKGQIAVIQTAMYYEYLQNNGIHLEDVLQWFFQTYLPEEFGCPKIMVLFPKSDDTYAHKCVQVAPLFESVLKQFICYVQNQEIYYDLIASESQDVIFNQVPSLLNSKYVYGKGELFNKICYLLFSDQCMLTYPVSLQKVKADYRYRCFADLVTKKKICLSDYNGYNEYLGYLYFLRDQNLIHIGSDGTLSLLDTQVYRIIKGLQHYGVISKWHHFGSSLCAIENLEKIGMLEISSTLFTRQESAYLNYMLNQRQFVNGPDLRNRYLHGSLQMVQDEAIHKWNYFTFLQLFILLVIKINDDFCLKDQQDKQNQKDKQNA